VGLGLGWATWRRRRRAAPPRAHRRGSGRGTDAEDRVDVALLRYVALVTGARGRVRRERRGVRTRAAELLAVLGARTADLRGRRRGAGDEEQAARGQETDERAAPGHRGTVPDDSIALR
jgi:hypothetical protein